MIVHFSKGGVFMANKKNSRDLKFWIKKPKCSSCNRVLTSPNMWCPDCGEYVSVGPINGHYSDNPMNSMWDLSEFLPNFSKKISLSEGATPILNVKNIKNLQGLLLKLENRNPTGTFRDRCSSLIVSHALSKQASTVHSVSTGSYGISLAAYCATAGLKSINILPQNTELSKIEQLKIFGSELIQHGESLNEAREYAKAMNQEQGIYIPKPKENLLTIEAQKTIALEFFRIYGDNIKNILVPQGSGSLTMSIIHGIQDAICSDWLKIPPRVISVSLKKDSEMSYLIESLEIDEQEKKLLSEVNKKLKKNNGLNIEIDPNQMINDAMELAKKEGHFIEPASASVISAAKSLYEKKEIDPKNTIAILTGSGLNALNVFASKIRKIKKVVWGLAPASTCKFEILNLIAENKADNGSEIWKALGKKHTRQSIYQHLSQLEENGLISAKMKTKKAKKYTLTRKGFEALDKMRELIDLI
ncbi:MAG: pyridoxal-phosphate dependent enzyme [Candidatus Lokiarchaeota archaeon]|nr:pyridoxal-phosphate dependent enzyme [Candidatus Lokiarchaeota archaeon]